MQGQIKRRGNERSPFLSPACLSDESDLASQPPSWNRKLKHMVPLLLGFMHLLPRITACSRNHLLPAAAPPEGGEAAVVLPLTEVPLGGTSCSQDP